MKYHFLKLTLLSTLSLAAYAGSMGPVMAPAPCANPFISIEGGYTWSETDGLNFTITDVATFHVKPKRDGGTARLAVGIMKPIFDSFMISGEMGYGYYGSSKLSFASGATIGLINNPSFRSSQDGLDALAGIIYYHPNYDIFFKAGALIQNSRNKLGTNFSVVTPLLPPTILSGTATVKSNQTQVLPEIKLGASYHICENLSLMGSWTHAFGAERSFSTTLNPVALTTNLSANLENPTLDVALLGLQYQFG